MRSLLALGRAVGSVLRGLYSRGGGALTTDPLLPSCLLRQRDHVEALESRIQTDTPISPGLNVEFFNSTAVNATPFYTTTVDPADMASLYQQVSASNTVTHVRFTGTIFLSDEIMGQNAYFVLPNAEGAVLTIGGQTLIDQPSINGDANLSGNVDLTDYNLLIPNFNHSGAWANGDFNGDGVVNLTDYNLLVSNWGHSAQPQTLNSTGTSWALEEDFQLDLYSFDGQGSPQVQWFTDSDPTLQNLAAMSFSTYHAPHVTAQDSTAFAGQPSDGVIATFTPMAAGTTAADYTAQVQWFSGATATAAPSIVANQDGTFSVVAHDTFAAAGDYIGYVTVSDSATGSLQGSDVPTIHVVQPQLHPTISGAGHATVGNPYTLTLGTTADPGASPASVWTIHWGDNSTDTVNAPATSITHVFSSASNPSITASVTDALGEAFDAAPLSVDVEYPPPTIDPIGSASYAAGDLATVALGFQDTNVSNTHTATINWGDGTATEAAEVTEGGGSGVVFGNHVYAVAGTYTAIAALAGTDGRSIQESGQITVTNAAPMVDTFATSAVDPGQSIYLSTTFADADLWDTHTATVNWGDGTTETATVVDQEGDTSGTVSGSHVYQHAGSYAAAFTVTDASGASNTSSAQVVVNRLPLSADAGPTQHVIAGNALWLYGQYTDTDNDVNSFLWVVTDSNGDTIATGTDQAFSFTPTTPGQYTATFSFTDTASNGAAASATIIALDPSDPSLSDAPEAPTGLSVSNATPDGVTLNWSASPDDPDGYEIQWSQDGENFYTIDSVGPGVTSYTDSNPLYNTTTYYRVTSFRNDLDSAPTNTQSVKVVTAPTAFDNDNWQDFYGYYGYWVSRGHTLNAGLSITADDMNFGGGSVSIVSHTNPSHGSLTLNADGTFSYAADDNFIGTDTFTYTTNNGHYDSTPATVAIQVIGNPPFMLNSQQVFLVPDTTHQASGTLTWQSHGRPVTIDIIANVRYGQLSVNQATGSFSYTSNADFPGADSFTVVVDDGTEKSQPEQVVLYEWSSNGHVSASGIAYGDNQALTDPQHHDPTPFPLVIGGLPVTVLQGPSHGTLMVATSTIYAGGECYFADPGYVGPDDIVVQLPGMEPYTIRMEDADYDPVDLAGAPPPPPDFYVNLHGPLRYGVADDSATTFSGLTTRFTLANGGWYKIYYNGYYPAGEVYGPPATASVSLGHGPEHGSVVFGSDGSFTYVPKPDPVHGTFDGVDYFSYNATFPDGQHIEQWIELNVGIPYIPTFYAAPGDASITGDSAQDSDTAVAASGDSVSLAVARVKLQVQLDAAQQDLKNVLTAINAFGKAVSDFQTLPDPIADDQETAVSNALDTVLGSLDNVTKAYDTYIQQASATTSAAGRYMRDVNYLNDDDGKVIAEINALPRDVAFLSPDRKQMVKWEGALAQFQNGADFLVASTTFAVTAARETHAALETALQLGGLASIAASGSELLLKEGCEAFAKWTAKQIVNTAAAVGVNAAFSGVQALAQKYGVPTDYLAIGTDALQVFFLIKAARAQQKAAGANCFAAGTAVATAAGGEPIEDIHLGQRVLTQVFASGSGEPTNAAGDPNSTSVDPSTWREVDFDMPDGSGGDYTMQLLEPLSWISQNRAGAGGQVYLDLPELQLSGEAKVLSIKACPVIAQAQGRVVLGTFQHVSSDLVDVRLVGDSTPLRVTSGHMLWSVDRDGWVDAGELKPGERLATKGGIAVVQSVIAESGSTEVYNLDVETDHRYFAGDGQILAHNANPCAGAGGNGAASEFGSLEGMSRADVDAYLKSRGFTAKPTTPGGYTEYSHPDGSKVYIRPDGQIVRTAAPIYDATGRRINRGTRLGPDGKEIPRATSHDKFPTEQLRVDRS